MEMKMGRSSFTVLLEIEADDISNFSDRHKILL